MYIALKGVERVGILGELVFSIAVNVVERVEVWGFPVVGAVNDSIFQITVVIAFQIVVIQAKLLSTAQGDERVAHGNGDRGKTNTGQSINIRFVVKGDVVVLLRPEAEQGKKYYQK